MAGPLILRLRRHKQAQHHDSVYKVSPNQGCTVRLSQKERGWGGVCEEYTHPALPDSIPNMDVRWLTTVCNSSYRAGI